MSGFLISQIIVAIALVFDLGSVQLRERHYLILGQAIAATLIATHFFVLGIHTAGWMFTLGAVRLAISLKWRNAWVKTLFFLLIVSTALYSYETYLSLISCMASLLMAAGAFAHSLRNLRLLFIAGSSTWLIHNLLAWTPVGILMEVLFLSSNLLAYYRFFIQKNVTCEG